MSEALLPESVGFVTLGKENSGGICGFVHRCKDIESCSQKILISLAGKRQANCISAHMTGEAA